MLATSAIDRSVAKITYDNIVEKGFWLIVGVS